ncbi:ogr/Delta-like zinc finger family protein [Xanthomonas campestris pv. campestris]|uniref:ogr/Delta-like zinc finger family protein n=1 Tax=Xanthomonas TaxID=338 RepID=UPI000CDA573F|nr:MULTISPECIES: ogr/Delta-like zinc finger family protein [Xanthomonas]MBB6259345.1 ribosomal protein L37AE/L43A [Xanthomonas arboricola]TXD43091.1 hypothetical protein TR80_009555 [Xanthomonas campestris]
MSAFSTRKKVVFSCEACGSPLVKRTSFLSHRYLRHDTYVCDNPVCGASYTGHTELTHVASPSGMPNAHSDLPPTPAYTRAMALRVYQAAANERQLELLPETDLAALAT